MVLEQVTFELSFCKNELGEGGVGLVQVEGTTQVKTQRQEGLKVKILKGGHSSRA